MTNKEAKREIDNIDYYLQHHTDDYSERSHDAMMMAISALERQTGEWIGLYVGDGEVKYECSVCGFIASGKWKYCCECGADMRKESK